MPSLEINIQVVTKQKTLSYNYLYLPAYLFEAGAKVINIGLVPTHEPQRHGGIQLTHGHAVSSGAVVGGVWDHMRITWHYCGLGGVRVQVP